MIFTYAGRDTINQAMKGLNNLAPKLINQASKEIEKIAEVRIRQVINSGRQLIQNYSSIIHRLFEEL